MSDLVSTSTVIDIIYKYPYIKHAHEVGIRKCRPARVLDIFTMRNEFARYTCI